MKINNVKYYNTFANAKKFEGFPVIIHPAPNVKYPNPNNYLNNNTYFIK